MHPCSMAMRDFEVRYAEWLARLRVVERDGGFYLEQVDRDTGSCVNAWGSRFQSRREAQRFMKDVATAKAVGE